MDSKKEITPGEKRIKHKEYIFYIYGQDDNTMRVDCENRKTNQKFISDDIKLERLKPETFIVALEETQQNIQCRIINVDAKLILQVKVNHEFLPLITETVELNLISEKELDHNGATLRNLNLEIEEIKEEMKELCLHMGNNIVQDQSCNGLNSQAVKVGSLNLSSNGKYIVTLNFNAKSTNSEPNITVTATFNDNKREEKVYEETIQSQFAFTSYTTFQTIKFIVDKTKMSQKNLDIELSSNQNTNITNVNITLCKAC